MSVDHGMFQKLVFPEEFLKLGGGDEVIVDPVDLAAALGAGGVGDGVIERVA
jgi:hypothetical protein